MIGTSRFTEEDLKSLKNQIPFLYFSLLDTSCSYCRCSQQRHGHVISEGWSALS